MKKYLSWVYNPFTQLAGWKAFGIGFIILCLATFVGYLGNTVFYGISIKTVQSVTLGNAFFLQFMGLAVTVLIMWATALVFAKHVRFQDILGTITFAKYPLTPITFVIWLFNKPIENFTNKMLSIDLTNYNEIANLFTVFDYLLILLITIVIIPMFVWTIALLFNAFRVSTNLKGGKCILLFIAALLISEILIMVILSVFS